MRGTEYMGEGGLGGRKKWGQGVTRILWLAFQKNLKEACMSQGNASLKNYLLESTFCIYPRYAQMDFIMPHRSIRIHMQLSNIMNGIDFQLLSNLKN